MRNVTLEKQAKEVIIQQMEELGEMTTEEVVELIRPHYNFDVQAAKEQGLKRKAGQLIAQLKDEKGIRSCFNCKLDGESIYVNVDIIKDKKALTSVEKQLNKKLLGILESKNKVSRKMDELDKITHIIAK